MKRVSVMTQRRKRVVRAIQHLEDNLERDITLQELAEIACLSRFHFARTFVELVGYSPMMLMRRLRLLEAADLLARAALSVGDWQPRLGAFALVYEGEPVGGHADNWLDADVAVPVLSPVPSLAGFDPMTMPAGRYAVLKQRINDRRALTRLNDLVERVVAESGSVKLSSPAIKWHRYDPALRPQAMQCWWLLVPLGDVPAEVVRAR